MKKVTGIIAVAVIILLHSFVWISLKAVILKIEQENGVMENYQAICLAASSLLWLWSVLRSKTRADKIFFSVLMLFTATILVLEVDFRELNAPLVNAVMNGKIRNLWVGALWVAAIVLFLRNPKSVMNSFFSWLLTPMGGLMLLGGAFWIASALIDKSILGTKNLFNEELMEVNATLFMTASAVLSLRCRKKEERTPSDQLANTSA